MLHPDNGRGGASVMRLDNATGCGEGASAWAVVTRILKRLDGRLGQKSLEQVLLIQEELVRKKKSVPETEAAKAQRDQLEQPLRVQEEMLAFEVSAAQGDEEAEEKIRQKEEQLRAMHKAIQ